MGDNHYPRIQPLCHLSAAVCNIVRDKAQTSQTVCIDGTLPQKQKGPRCARFTNPNQELCCVDWDPVCARKWAAAHRHPGEPFGRRLSRLWLHPARAQRDASTSSQWRRDCRSKREALTLPQVSRGRSENGSGSQAERARTGYVSLSISPALRRRDQVYQGKAPSDPDPARSPAATRRQYDLTLGIRTERSDSRDGHPASTHSRHP